MKFVFVLVAVSASFASAQDCSTGTCQKPVRSAVTAVATPVVDVAEQTVRFAACGTQKAVAVATRPVKRVFARRVRSCR